MDGAMHHGSGSGTEEPDDFGTHNMLAFGRSGLYLSHLPMFMPPHDAQLLLEADIGGPDGTATDAWRLERAENPGVSLYTMNPEPFELSSLYVGHEPARTSFQATFFRGHLERGGEPISGLTDVQVRIGRVAYARRFDRGGKPDDLGYILVGRPDDWYLAHRIGEAPDFDQILAVSLAGEELDDDDLLAGVAIDFPGRQNTVEQRLMAGETADARGHVTGAHRYIDWAVEVTGELYFEEGELALPADFAPTPAEVAAGFGD